MNDEKSGQGRALPDADGKMILAQKIACISQAFLSG